MTPPPPPPPPYLLWVQSNPTKVSKEAWIKFYVQEHAPDLVKNKVSINSAFYQEIPLFPGVELDHDPVFLASYQTNLQEPLKSEGVTKIPQGHDILSNAGGSWSTLENAEWDVRNYELIQEYDPKGVGNGVYLLDVSFLPIASPFPSLPIFPSYLSLSHTDSHKSL